MKILYRYFVSNLYSFRISSLNQNPATCQSKEQMSLTLIFSGIILQNLALLSVKRAQCLHLVETKFAEFPITILQI